MKQPGTKDSHQDKVARNPIKIFPSQPIKKPSWLKIELPTSKKFNEVKNIIKTNRLHTVCEEASCPNIGECFSNGTATFMIMGDICTRRCPFCDVSHGRPLPLDKNEPKNLSKSINKLSLKYVVVTSVDRDDLIDGGASQFVSSIKEIRKISSGTTIEVLTPDFQRKIGALEKVINAKPDVFNHNLETVSRLYKKVRRGANYQHSLSILKLAKDIDPFVFTKSGIMVGLGETLKEIESLLYDLRRSSVVFVTIGQYMQPTKGHLPVVEYLTPTDFDYLKQLAYKMGFLLVSSSPLTRSSYHADDDFKKLKLARNISLNV